MQKVGGCLFIVLYALTMSNLQIKTKGFIACVSGLQYDKLNYLKQIIFHRSITREHSKF